MHRTILREGVGRTLFSLFERYAITILHYLLLTWTYKHKPFVLQTINKIRMINVNKTRRKTIYFIK